MPHHSFLKILFFVSQSYLKFLLPTPRIFKISLRHCNWPIRCLSKNSCVVKIRFNSRFSHDVTTAMLVPKTKKRWPCWCPDQILREFNSIIMQTLPFVFVEKHGCWSREWKPAIKTLSLARVWGIHSRISSSLAPSWRSWQKWKMYSDDQWLILFNVY